MTFPTAFAPVQFTLADFLPDDSISVSVSELRGYIVGSYRKFYDGTAVVVHDGSTGPAGPHHIPRLPDQQAGFRRGCSIVHQIVKLTNDIEASRKKKSHAGGFLLDPTADYDIVWHYSLILKLLESVQDRHLG